MGEFFKGWQRKAGYVCLVMSIACAVWWARGSILIAQVTDVQTIEYEVRRIDNIFAMIFCVEFAVLAFSLPRIKPRKSRQAPASEPPSQ